MNIDEFFEEFTGGNSNVSTWTPKAIKEFAQDFHKQQLSLNAVGRIKEALCSVFHTTDFDGKCMDCGNQIFIRDKNKEYCYRCGDYVGDGCDNSDCKDFKE